MAAPTLSALKLEAGRDYLVSPRDVVGISLGRVRSTPLAVAYGHQASRLSAALDKRQIDYPTYNIWIANLNAAHTVLKSNGAYNQFRHQRNAWVVGPVSKNGLAAYSPGTRLGFSASDEVDFDRKLTDRLRPFDLPAAEARVDTARAAYEAARSDSARAGYTQAVTTWARTLRAHEALIADALAVELGDLDPATPGRAEQVGARLASFQIGLEAEAAEDHTYEITERPDFLPTRKISLAWVRTLPEPWQGWHVDTLPARDSVLAAVGRTCDKLAEVATKLDDAVDVLAGLAHPIATTSGLSVGMRDGDLLRAVARRSAESARAGSVEGAAEAVPGRAASVSRPRGR